MSRVKTMDMIGQTYNYLTVLSFDHWKQLSTGKRAYVKVRCQCGKEFVVCGYSLRNGMTKSCGCYRKIANGTRTHGMSNTRIYKIYHDILRRCADKTRQQYNNYGGRGIKVCEEWQGENGFINFYNWSMENGYSDSLSIDRIDNDGNYEPNNCRWTDSITQANNTRWNVHIEYKGQVHTIAEWGRITNLDSSRICQRLYKYGWSVGEALGFESHKTPYHSEVLYTINGETHNVAEWCRIRGISKDTVRYRREHNWTPEEIFGFKERSKC